jgi:hypothetical protein
LLEERFEFYGLRLDGVVKSFLFNAERPIARTEAARFDLLLRLATVRGSFEDVRHNLLHA